jgi:dihydrofolate reductase
VRKVIAVELVSLDGVMEAPEEWAFSYSNEEMEAANAKGMAASDAMLVGRTTYEGLAAFWPHQPGGTPMVDYINSVRKFVVSTTLEEVGWNNSTLIKDKALENIAELKRQPGKDITIIGSAAGGRPPGRAAAYGSSARSGRRKTSLRGRWRARNPGAGELGGVRHGRRLPRLPAVRRK